jgi:hypothetical protein
MCVWQRNEQKPTKHSEKLIYSTRSRPTVHHRIRGKNHARTSTKPLCESSKRLLRSINPYPVSSAGQTVPRKVLFRCAHDPGLRSMSSMGMLRQQSYSEWIELSMSLCPIAGLEDRDPPGRRGGRKRWWKGLWKSRRHCPRNLGGRQKEA